MKIDKSLNFKDIGLIIFLGVFGIAILVEAWHLENKWFVFLLSLPIGLALVSMVPAERRDSLFLHMFIFLIPVGLRFHPIYYQLSIFTPIAGFSISMWEGPFFILFLSWLVRRTIDPRAKVDLVPWFSIPFLLIWIISLAGMYRSLMPIGITLSLEWKFLESWLVFIYLANNIKKGETLLLIALVLVATIIPQVVTGFLQEVSGGLLGLGVFGEAESGVQNELVGFQSISRVGGTIGHPNSLALYLAMVIPICVALLFSKIKKSIKTLFLWPTLVGALILLVLTYSRAGWLATVFGTGIVVLWCVLRMTRLKFVSVFFLMLSFMIVVPSLILFVEPIQKRLFEDDYNAAQSRVPMALVAYNMISQNPWTGVGLANYTSVAKGYDTTREAITYWFNFPVHNGFLLVAAELGLPALGLLIIILTGVLLQLYRVGHSSIHSTTSTIAIGLLGSMIAYIFNRLFDFEYIFISTKVWALAGLACATAKIALEERKTQEHTVSPVELEIAVPAEAAYRGVPTNSGGR